MKNKLIRTRIHTSTGRPAPSKSPIVDKSQQSFNNVKAEWLAQQKLKFKPEDVHAYGVASADGYVLKKDLFCFFFVFFFFEKKK